MTSGTPWLGGRFDNGSGPRQLLFGRMYEDVEIERRAFPRGSRVFCIASAGCTAIRLSAEHEVTAVDINPVQLAYAKRRASGAPLEVGAAERILHLGRKALPLLGWRRNRVEAFLGLETPVEQIDFWRRHLNTRRFRHLFDAVMSPGALRRAYASSFLRNLPPHFGRILRSRMERCWSLHANRANPYARALLLGDPGPPPLLERAPTIRFAHADAAEFLEGCSPGSYNAFALSNILDGATEHYRRRLLAAVVRAGTPGSVMVVRSFSEPETADAANFAAEDRSMLWGVTRITRTDAME